VNRETYWLAKQVSKKYKYDYVRANRRGVFMKKTEIMYDVCISNPPQLMSIDTEK